MLDLKEVRLTEDDAKAIADHANRRETARLNDLARAFNNTRRYVDDEGWRVVGQSDYPASGLYMERNGERALVTYE